MMLLLCFCTLFLNHAHLVRNALRGTMRDILQRDKLLWRRIKMKYLEQFHSLEIMIKFWDVCHKFWQKVILIWKAWDQIFSSSFCDRFCFTMMIKLCRMLHSLTFSASLLTKDSCWLKLLRRSLETFNTFLRFSIKGGPCLFTRFFCFAVFDYIGAR